MNNKVMIIGNNSADYHLGATLARATKLLEIDSIVANADVYLYSPSMQQLWGKIFYKIAGKRSVEWWNFNQKLVSLIKNSSPTIVIVTGIIPLVDDVFTACQEVGAIIVNYLTDSPWSKQNSHPIFIETITKYDCIFSTKTAVVSELHQANAKKIEFLPFAFDPLFHKYVPTNEMVGRDSTRSDVCLIGGADQERISFINQFLTKFQGSLDLYGGFWNKDKNLKQYYHGIVTGDDFCQAISSSKINIGLVRRANKDGHSMRSYEIPACGGTGIYEDTPEHRNIFFGYPEHGFFKSPEDLAEKCNWLLVNPIQLEEMRQLGMQLVVNDSNTYTARLKTILEWVNK